MSGRPSIRDTLEEVERFLVDQLDASPEDDQAEQLLSWVRDALSKIDQ